MTDQTKFDLWCKQDRIMKWSIIQVWFTSKIKLSYKDLSHRVRSMMKTVTNHTRVIYAKNESKLSWSIELGVHFDENQIGQWRDR